METGKSAAVRGSVAEGDARVVSRSETEASRWVRLVRKEVQFSAGGAVQVYHCLAQADYVSIVARTRSGRVPIVRQFRPAVECYTWELPAGLVDPGENPEQTCRRELHEEAGLETLSLRHLGKYHADTGRLENAQHVFLVEASDPPDGFVAEPGLLVRYVESHELAEMIRRHEFSHQLHVGALLTASLHGFSFRD